MPDDSFDPTHDDRVPPPRHGHGHGHGPGDDVIAQARDLLGYDPVETKMIEADTELHALVVERLAQPGKLIPAERVFGSLDDD